jgi:pyruvate-ferredoxin/flavodoxin oxidoreductase
MAENKKFLTLDGNGAAAHIAYIFSEVAAIYPITPSSNMAEYADEWAAAGRKNIFGEKVEVVEMQSEGGAAGAVHGSLQAGALTTTFTASQGLLLMIPNMYKIAGELLPAVFHVSARTLAAHALSIFGDHSDIYSTRQTGFAMLATSSVQQVMDLASVAHLAAIKSRVPFMHFFDGFRTSHEIQKIEALYNEDFMDLVDWDALKAFRAKSLNPENPVTRGTAQNPDIFFQAKEAVNPYYENLADIVADYMDKMSKKTGREYKPFTYYGAADAKHVIVAMGSVTDTIKETIDLLLEKGEKIGLVTVHLFRPFSAKHVLAVLPESVEILTVLDRTKEIGATGDPLYLDFKEMFYDKAKRPVILGGRYGLSSKDTTPSQIISVYENMKLATPKNKFTVGIVDDVTFTSLPLLPEVIAVPKGTYEAKFYGLGSDGTVGANKNSIKIIGDNTDKYAQAYFSYDSKKSGGITISHLRFGDKEIRATYLVTTPDFVACHVPSYLEKYDMLKGLKKGGTFLLNSIWEDEETINRLPNQVKKYLAENQIKFYTINATKIAAEIGLGNRTNTIMQSAFFKISNVIPYELAVKEMKKAIIKTFGRKGEEIVKMNNASVDRGGEYSEIQVPAEWAKLEGPVASIKHDSSAPEFIHKIVDPINSLKGDDLPVSAFKGREDGTFPQGTSAFEKRGIAVDIPEWNAENCIQCNICSYVCPHAAIRPFLINAEEEAALPAGTVTLDAIGKDFKGLKYRIQISALDCTGCGVCVEECPGRKSQKALVMQPLESQMIEAERWEHFDKHVSYKEELVDVKSNVKNSQFAQPLFEFSGACAGCGETPYVKLVTQLFGQQSIISNATGCSSIYGGSAPSTPYTLNKKSGFGPAWANSLFEDNAEYGFGMAVAVSQLRKRIKLRLEANMNNFTAPTQEAAKEWITGMNSDVASKEAADKLIPLLEKEANPAAIELIELRRFLVKKSMWIVGGDGWAYDIGYGGLDHVLASGENINILVLDTEVYSNTGGQASKSSFTGQVAKFATAGKKTRKKDLGAMAMTYGNVYVAQIAMGANNAQTLKAIREAEAFNGPSLIIAYSPCIAHGLKGGMSGSQSEQSLAVEAGYWHMYRFNPALADQGQNPFTLDSKEPDWSKFQAYLKSEVRFSSLLKTFPGAAEELFALAEENAKWRYNSYLRMAQMDYSNN